MNLKSIPKVGMKFAVKIILWALGMVAICGITFAALFFYNYYTNPDFLFHPHPSDYELIANFEKNKSEFEQLAAMLITEDKLEVIFPDSNQCQIPNQRLISAFDNPSCARYVKMFQDLGLEWAYTKLWANNEHLWLDVSLFGLAVSGSSKGYYYSADGLPEYAVIADDTDKAEGQFIFRHIEGNWYIFITN